jgi:hypothetical protein
MKKNAVQFCIVDTSITGAKKARVRERKERKTLIVDKNNTIHH